MELGDLLVKISRNESLSPIEEDFVRQQGNQIQPTNDKVATWSRNGGNSLTADNIYAVNGHFINPPSGLSCRATTATPVSFAHNTLTAVTFTQIRYDENSFMDLSVSGTTMNIKVSGYYQVFGYVRWGTGGTGERTIWLARGASATTQTLYVGASGLWTNNLVDEFQILAGQTMQLKALQTSGGGAIDLDAASLVVKMIRRI